MSRLTRENAAARFRNRRESSEASEVRDATSGAGIDIAAIAADSNGSGDVAAALANIHAKAAAAGLSIVDVPVASLAPHPFNPKRRSRPQPGRPQWEELILSIRKVGKVVIPLRVVTRAAFLEHRPNMADRIPADAEYVMIYGHRRRAGALAEGLETVPAIVDDSVMENGGDLIEMGLENSGRDDLSLVETAEHYANFIDDGLSQPAVADIMGVSQPTVSRHLALLWLSPEAQDLVSTEKRPGTIGLVAAETLARELPIGTARWEWQTYIDDEVATSQQRVEDQRTALTYMLDGVPAKRAVERVRTEHRSRRAAADAGFEVVEDPRERFGDLLDKHQLPEAPEAGTAGIVAALDEDTRTLVYFRESLPESEPDATQPGGASRKQRSAPDAAKAADEEGRLRSAAQRSRRVAAASLAAKGASKDRLGALLIQLTKVRVRTDSPRAWALAHSWLHGGGAPSAASVAEWQDQFDAETDQKAIQRGLWAVALAACETRAADKTREWDALDAAYLGFLVDGAEYAPTPWETKQLARLRSPAADPIRPIHGESTAEPPEDATVEGSDSPTDSQTHSEAIHGELPLPSEE
ncbi:ParB/RepB/Spo0J family partition protein [Nocardia neocaledoniensis]|uniref:ParB/RepB/Spo0J family partition protein n=1 Tax=Nocardia neocaledoniensis TaxID=236511 RepID=UPI002454FCF1|nr:transcriptional regulator [Nocardia neocaledoniensis]